MMPAGVAASNMRPSPGPAPATPVAPTIENALQAKVAGQIAVVGRVVEADGQTGVSEVTVGVAGGARTTATNDSGSFGLVMPDTGTITVERFGYRPTQVALSPGEDEVTIRMTRDTLYGSWTEAPGHVTASGSWLISGRVVDAGERAPVAGAAVIVHGTTIGSTTNDNGAFKFPLPTDAKSFSVRRIGYLAENVPITPGTTDYTIPLKKDVLSLEAQVVTGISTQRAATAAPVAGGSSGNAGAPGGGLRAITMGSSCREQIVRVRSATAGASAADSVDARLTATPSQSLDQGGFVVRLVPDTTMTPAGSWQPLGPDSAIVGLRGPRGVTASRVGCEVTR
jgi:CarboxypepD_reg-like domain